MTKAMDRNISSVLREESGQNALEFVLPAIALIAVVVGLYTVRGMVAYATGRL